MRLSQTRLIVDAETFHQVDRLAGMIGKSKRATATALIEHALRRLEMFEIQRIKQMLYPEINRASVLRDKQV